MISVKVISIKKDDINHDVLFLLSQHLNNQSLKEINDTLTKALHKNHVRLFVLYDDINPIGFCYGNLSIGLESKGYYFWINEFYISSNFRNQGCGHFLMSHIKENLKKVKISYIALVTSKLNQKAQTFFIREGFKAQDYLWFDVVN